MYLKTHKAIKLKIYLKYFFIVYKTSIRWIIFIYLEIMFAKAWQYGLGETSKVCTDLIHNVIIRIWRLILKSCANINLLRSLKKPSSPYSQLLIFFCFLNLFCVKQFFPIIIIIYTLIFCCYLSNDYNIDFRFRCYQTLW